MSVNEYGPLQHEGQSTSAPAKRTRGQSKNSLTIIDNAYEILEEIQPATVRAVCYKLFVRKLIPSMAKSETNKISRLLRLARESDNIPWGWIVDETRSAEGNVGWSSPERFANSVVRSYRKNYWRQQPVGIQVWSEKGTVRGTVAPVLDEFGVLFRVMHGYSSATSVHEIAEESLDSSVPLLVFYVGDWDPSGLHMSEVDLPARLDKYGASNINITRIALDDTDTGANSSLPEFAAEEKSDDPRYKWFVRHYGTRCFELDALDPNDLRNRVRQHILAKIDTEAWNRCVKVEKAEHESLTKVMQDWGRVSGEAA